ncbi:MAG: 4Fe-4S dicluster domain-containing protein [Promethearchaeota archaeon]
MDNINEALLDMVSEKSENLEVYHPNEDISLVYLLDRCKGCSLCIKACHLKVLEISKTEFSDKGYPRLKVIRPNQCIGCSRCEMACPDFAIYVKKNQKKVEENEFK